MSVCPIRLTPASTWRSDCALSSRASLNHFLLLLHDITNSPVAAVCPHNDDELVCNPQWRPEMKATHRIGLWVRRAHTFGRNLWSG